MFERTERWMPAVYRETLDGMAQHPALAQCVPQFDNCTRERDVLLSCEMRNTVGLILFAAQSERECLSILGGLARKHEELVTLVICEDRHAELMPVMYEAGADTILFNVRDDVPIGRWCVRVLQQRLN